MPSTPEELLKRLAATPEYTYPLELLTEIRDRLPEMIPALLTVLQDARQFPDDFSDRTSAWMQPMFAAYFLAEAREKAAYRPLIALLNLPSDDVDVLFGEMITGDMGRILASVFDGDEQPLRDLVENPEVPEFVRSCCGLGPYLCLLHNQLLTAEAVSGYFTELMRGRLADQNQIVWSSLASHCGDLGFAHLIPDIQAAYGAGWCDPMFDHEENVVLHAGNGGNPRWQRDAELIGDTIELTRHWHCFKPKPLTQPSSRRGNIKTPQFFTPTSSSNMRSTPKIGRNDPCPCASGKKYKKCCGA